MMLKNLYRTAAVAALASLPFNASALDFTVSQFASGQLGDTTGARNVDSRTDYAAIRGDTFATIFATEDFEGFTDLGQIGENNIKSLETDVGQFTTLNGKDKDPDDASKGSYSTDAGSGSTAVDQENRGRGASGVDNDERGRNLSIRQNGDKDVNGDLTDNGGRQNTSFTNGNSIDGFTDNTYLDSNDTRGFRWVAQTANNDLFDRLLFTLTDPSDQGKDLTISADGFSETFEIKARQNNGEIFNVLIGFSTAVNSATISMAKSGLNDGFSADNFSVGAVPLPAAAWLLLGVSGALVGAKRRSARKAA